MQPHSCCALGLRAGEDRSGGLGKRASWVGQSGAVRWRSEFKHLRFATPARAALPDPPYGAFGRMPQPGPVGGERRPLRLGQAGHPPCNASAGAITWAVSAQVDTRLGVGA